MRECSRVISYSFAVTWLIACSYVRVNRAILPALLPGSLFKDAEIVMADFHNKDVWQNTATLVSGTHVSAR